MKSVDIKIDIDHIEQMLEKIINHNDKKNLAKVIAHNIAKSPVGMEQLCKVLLGINFNLKYTVGQHVWIDQIAAPTWRMNEAVMKENGMIFQNKIKGIIQEADMYKTEQYLVSFEIIEGSTNNLHTDSYYIGESYLSPNDDDQIELI